MGAPNTTIQLRRLTNDSQCFHHPTGGARFCPRPPGEAGDGPARPRVQSVALYGLQRLHVLPAAGPDGLVEARARPDGHHGPGVGAAREAPGGHGGHRSSDLPQDGRQLCGGQHAPVLPPQHHCEPGHRAPDGREPRTGGDDDPLLRARRGHRRPEHAAHDAGRGAGHPPGCCGQAGGAPGQRCWH